jgi:hypothetical protein
MALQQLKEQVLELTLEDRWTLLKLLIELLQPSSLSTSSLIPEPITSTSLNAHPLSQFYGCIDDDTFVRHSQPKQPERELILLSSR